MIVRSRIPAIAEMLEKAREKVAELGLRHVKELAEMDARAEEAAAEKSRANSEAVSAQQPPGVGPNGENGGYLAKFVDVNGSVSG